MSSFHHLRLGACVQEPISIFRIASALARQGIEKTVMGKAYSLRMVLVLALHLCGLMITQKTCLATPVRHALSADIVTHVHKRTSHTRDLWQINVEVCPPSLCGASGEASTDPAPRPQGTGGTVFYQGDITVDSDIRRYLYTRASTNKRRPERATVRMRKRLWKNGVVPYVFAETLTPRARSALLQAFAHIQNRTCITFREKLRQDTDVIKFISEPGCWSGIGRVGGVQLLSLGAECENLATALHEITHSLGVWHEQARSDRDSYVRVLEENVSEKFLPDFEKVSRAVATSRGYPYDYRSIMHYSMFAFTRNGKPTLEVTGVGKNLGITLQPRTALSTIDVAQLRDLYSCNQRTDARQTACPSSWLQHDTSCYKFFAHLSMQFAAAAKHCLQLNSHLVFIESWREDDFLAKRMRTKFPAVTTWRTGGRFDNTSMVWYRAESDTRPVTYSNWAADHPGTHTSLVIQMNRQTNRTEWRGAWAGSSHQLPAFSYPFICERRARRSCHTLRHSDGRDYRGQLDHTVDGDTCQRWTERYPHAHNLTKSIQNGGDHKQSVREDSDGLGNHNYCRNPSGRRRSRPWCYTTKRQVEWQLCDVSVCSTTTTTFTTSPPAATTRPTTRSFPSSRRRQSVGFRKGHQGMTSGGSWRPPQNDRPFHRVRQVLETRRQTRQTD